MATRWYFGNDPASKTPTAGTWDGPTVSGYVRTELRTASQLPTAQAAYISASEIVGSAVRYWFGYSDLYQFITKPLTAQTINSGTTFRLQAIAFEDSGSANCYHHLKLRHFNSSDVQQGSDYDADGVTEFPGTTTTDAVNRYAIITLASNLSVSSGDYFVVEIGGYFNNTMTSLYLGQSYVRTYSAAKSDLGSNETDTDKTLNPWLECSQTLTFVTSAVKTLEGLAIAGVKTVEGLAKSAVKTIEGLA